MPSWAPSARSAASKSSRYDEGQWNLGRKVSPSEKISISRSRQKEANIRATSQTLSTGRLVMDAQYGAPWRRRYFLFFPARISVSFMGSAPSISQGLYAEQTATGQSGATLSTAARISFASSSRDSPCARRYASRYLLGLVNKHSCCKIHYVKGCNKPNRLYNRCKHDVDFKLLLKLINQWMKPEKHCVRQYYVGNYANKY